MTFAHPSLARLSESQATDYGEKTAITFAGNAYSYTQMHERTLTCAADLHSQGVRRGDRVAYLGPNPSRSPRNGSDCFTELAGEE